MTDTGTDSPTNNPIETGMIAPVDPQTTAFTVKVITGMVAAKPISAWLLAHGVQLDPVLVGAGIATGLHKLHEFAKNPQTWTWKNLF